MKIEEYIKNKLISTLTKWEKKDIYAISLLIYTNEDCKYNGCPNFPQLSISFNTEAACDNAPLLSEERWNFAYWDQNDEYIIHPEENQTGAALLWAWFQEKQIENIGFEDISYDKTYDKNGNYIGKGPNGLYEFVCLVSKIVKQLQESSLIKEKWGNIPVLIHDFDYSWFMLEETEKANPHGEAENFLKTMKNIN